MNLFLPETGLIIWMLVAFLVVLFILCKFGWPVIMNIVKQRNEAIAEGLKNAELAKTQLADMEQKTKEMLDEAHAEQIRIMRESQEMKKRMIEDSKTQAKLEAEKIIRETRMRMEREKEEAISQVKGEVVSLTIAMAEKVLQNELRDKEAQCQYVDKLLSEEQMR